MWVLLIPTQAHPLFGKQFERLIGVKLKLASNALLIQNQLVVVRVYRQFHVCAPTFIVLVLAWLIVLKTALPPRQGVVQPPGQIKLRLPTEIRELLQIGHQQGWITGRRRDSAKP